MPGITQYVLVGGPCDGKHGDLTQNIDATGQLVCQNHVYKRVEPAKVQDGREVFRDAGPVPNPSPPVPSPRLHHGWRAVQRAFNKRLPPAIKQARRDTDAALRSIGRGRKVRH